jgi:NAD(P)-dependent dehydrogenase (short-subunit alcohol dehydrogenase family)
MSGRLDGKVAIITGAASGIGRASAELFRAEGATVIPADRTAGDGIVAADAGSEADVEALVAQAVADHGGLDIFFANAGISGSLDSVLEQTVEEWTEVLRVNLIGAFLAVKHAAPRMRERGSGSIVCTASVAGMGSGAAASAYSAAKAGVINLVKLSAQQLSGSNIRVNAICPGLIETGMTRFVFDRARERGVSEKIGHLNPLKRAGQPEEIAAAALFLASDEASYVNGHALVVDGGHTSSFPVNAQHYGRTAI